MNCNIPFFGFDIDDVCFHSFHVIADTIMKWYGKEINEPKNFKLTEECPDIDPSDVYKAIDYSLIERFDYMEPVHGSLLFIKRYYAITKQKIVFITSRNPSRLDRIESATHQLITKWFPNIEYEVYFPKGEGKTKGVVCSELGIDVFIDDRVKYCVDVSNNGCLALMMTRKWNKKFDDPEGKHKIVRVGNWNDVNIIFESLCKCILKGRNNG